MAFVVYLVLLTTLITLFNVLLKRKKLLISETGDNHQKFASDLKIPLTGGIFLFLFLHLFFANGLVFTCFFSLAIIKSVFLLTAACETL